MQSRDFYDTESRCASQTCDLWEDIQFPVVEYIQNTNKCLDITVFSSISTHKVNACLHLRRRRFELLSTSVSCHMQLADREQLNRL